MSFHELLKINYNFKNLISWKNYFSEPQIQEMSINELKKINGCVIGICVAALALGYADGRSDKHEKQWCIPGFKYTVYNSIVSFVFGIH